MLRAGGNAIDAAITAVAVQSVVEPYNTGLGGDCLMLLWVAREKKLYALNGTGRAPARATREEFERRGLAEVPPLGILSVTVPGAVDAWCTALARFGTRTLAEALEPAIAYAAEGFPVSEVVAREWGLAVRAGWLGNDAARRCFTESGEPPSVGSIVRLPELARTLRLLAAGGRDVFYAGEIADRVVALAEQNDGLLSREDLAAHRSMWLEPISTDYRGFHLYELPPSTQGVAALLALNILECFEPSALAFGTAETLHLRIEATKLAFADRDRFVADPELADVPTAALLDKEYARRRARLINPRRAIDAPVPGLLGRGSDTVYLTVVDCDGNVVSLINSLFGAFGSGLVASDTGIVLQNRARGFVLDPAHPNCIAPGKRPFHTLIPAMLFSDGAPRVSFGVMGADVQAQGHLQVVANLIDDQLNIQEALDAPRFHYLGNAQVALEDEFSARVKERLCELGHTVADPFAALLRGGFGGGQGIMIHPETGAYWGGSDRRKDGCAIGY